MPIQIIHEIEKKGGTLRFFYGLEVSVIVSIMKEELKKHHNFQNTLFRR